MQCWIFLFQRYFRCVNAVRAACVRHNAHMEKRSLGPELERWVVAQAIAGNDPGNVLQPLLDDGWGEQEAVDAVAAAVNA